MGDGAVHETVEEHNRGSAANPMTAEEIIAKFDENASDVLDADRRRRVVDALASLESPGDACELIDLAVR